MDLKIAVCATAADAVAARQFWVTDNGFEEICPASEGPWDSIAGHKWTGGDGTHTALFPTTAGFCLLFKSP